MKAPITNEQTNDIRSSMMEQLEVLTHHHGEYFSKLVESLIQLKQLTSFAMLTVQENCRLQGKPQESMMPQAHLVAAMGAALATSLMDIIESTGEEIDKERMTEALNWADRITESVEAQIEAAVSLTSGRGMH